MVGCIDSLIDEPNELLLTDCIGAVRAYRVGGGFHTIELSIRLTYSESEQLRADIANSGLFYLENKKPRQAGNSLWFYYKPTRIGPRGLRLILRASKFSPSYLARHKHDIVIADPMLDEELTCTLIAVVNGKLLGGVKDYISPASKNDVAEMAKRFNEICREISPLMRDISCYRFRRKDACMNIVLHDLRAVAIDGIRRNRVDVTPWHIVQLIRMGDIPLGFVKGVYDRTTDDRSMYLKSKSTNFNVYCKCEEMNDWKIDGIDPGVDIVRIEVQQLARSIGRKMNRDERLFENGADVLFDDDKNLRTVVNYWRRVVGWGDWYRYSVAEKMVKDKRFRADKCDRLLGVLRLIRMCGSVALAKQRLSGRDRVVFVNGLAELRKSGINGVCIPDEWGIEWIPNILEKWLMENDHSDLIVWDDG